MDAIPLSSTFYVIGGTQDMQNWDAAINNLKADESQNPQNAAMDEENIKYYEQLKANMEDLIQTAAQYRQSDNDPALSNKIKDLSANQQKFTQLLQLNDYISKLEAEKQSDPKNAALYDQEIQNAQQQKTLVQEITEASQQPGTSQDALNALVLQLQALREQDPNGPLSQGLISEDFLLSYGQYMNVSFMGHEYAIV